MAKITTKHSRATLVEAAVKGSRLEELHCNSAVNSEPSQQTPKVVFHLQTDIVHENLLLHEDFVFTKSFRKSLRVSLTITRVIVNLCAVKCNHVITYVRRTGTLIWRNYWPAHSDPTARTLHAAQRIPERGHPILFFSYYLLKLKLHAACTLIFVTFTSVHPPHLIFLE